MSIDMYNHILGEPYCSELPSSSYLRNLKNTFVILNSNRSKQGVNFQVNITKSRLEYKADYLAQNKSVFL